MVNAEWKQNNPEKYANYLDGLREKYRTNSVFREKSKAQHRVYYYKRSDKVIENGRIAKQKWRENNREYIRKTFRERNANVKFSVLAMYSNLDVEELVQPRCACCGESLIEFLTLDHIDGKGLKVGKGKVFKNVLQLELWLIKNNFPEGYRCLCYNCNCSLGHYGYCPHEWKLKMGISP